MIITYKKSKPIRKGVATLQPAPSSYSREQ